MNIRNIFFITLITSFSLNLQLHASSNYHDKDTENQTIVNPVVAQQERIIQINTNKIETKDLWQDTKTIEGFSFLGYPEDIYKIFTRFLSLEDLLNLRSVSMAYKAVAESASIWNGRPPEIFHSRYTQRRLPSFFQRYANSVLTACDESPISEESKVKLNHFLIDPIKTDKIKSNSTIRKLSVELYNLIPEKTIAAKTIIDILSECAGDIKSLLKSSIETHLLKSNSSNKKSNSSNKNDLTWQSATYRTVNDYFSNMKKENKNNSLNALISFVHGSLDKDMLCEYVFQNNLLVDLFDEAVNNSNPHILFNTKGNSRSVFNKIIVVYLLNDLGLLKYAEGVNTSSLLALDEKSVRALEELVNKS